MRITQVLLSDRVGGAETLAKALADEWSELGISNEIVYVDPPSSPPIRRQPLARAFRLRRRLAQAESDVLLAHSAIPAVYARLTVPFGSLTYSVLHSAGDDFLDVRLNLAERVLRLRSDGIVAVSEAQADLYRMRFGGSVPIHVIPNGVRPSMTRSPLGDSDDWKSSPRTICAVARLVPQKNPELWIKAASAILREYPDMSAEWWGSSEDEEFGLLLRRQAQTMGLDGVFHGSTEKPEDVYRRCDILLHTSAREAHSVGLLEAAAMGVPILCSKDVAATLPAGIEVTTFRTDDLDDLLSVLRSVIADWGDKRVIARGQALEVARRHGIRDTALRYMSLFEHDLSAHRGRTKS